MGGDAKYLRHAIDRVLQQRGPCQYLSLLEGVERTFEMLTRQPVCGVPYRTRNPNLPRVRMLPVTGFENYLVFYDVEAEVMRVLYVLHGARHLRRLFRREPRA